MTNQVPLSKVKRYLEKARWLAMVAVVVLLLSMVLLVFVGLYELYAIISYIYDGFFNGTHLDINNLAAGLLGIVDLYLLAVVMYIFAIALYKLFIGNYEYYKWLKVEDMNDLKIYMVKMSLLFLSTFAIKKMVQFDGTGSEEMLIFAVSVSLIGAMLIWFSIVLKTKENHPQ